MVHPLQALGVTLRGVATETPMAPEIPLENARPAEYLFERQVEAAVASLHAPKSGGERQEGANLGDAA
jgi:hypothetical protein